MIQILPNILAHPVPVNAKDFQMIPAEGRVIVRWADEGPHFAGFGTTYLPLGSYEILFPTNKPDIKKLRKIVDVAIHIEDHEHMVKDGWWNYEGGEPFRTETESLQSLLRANRLTGENYLLIRKLDK